MDSRTMKEFDLPPAKYFPVSEQPLTMKAGLSEFGNDFGNSQRDSLYFQKDRQADLYRQAKEEVEPERHWTISENKEHTELHSLALSWIIEKQQSELGITPQKDLHNLQQALQENNCKVEALAAAYNSLSLNVQEDIALMAELPSPSLIMGNISMPSFWNPQRIKGADFCTIHRPVPNFPKDERMSQRLGTLMANKGPFVRFVWTVTNDNRLDHHPDKSRSNWKSKQPLWLRVERQITIPFKGLGSLFLIRTYLYQFQELNLSECETLKTAVDLMPEAVAHYKGLWKGKKTIIGELDRLILTPSS